MVDLFYQGEALYMSILTLLLLAIVILGIVTVIFVFKYKAAHIEWPRRYLFYVKSIGLFALIFGLFTQLLGLYGAFIAIKEWGSVSPMILSTGLWTSSIPSLYGLFIFLLSRIVRRGLAAWLNRTTNTT